IAVTSLAIPTLPLLLRQYGRDNQLRLFFYHRLPPRLTFTLFPYTTLFRSLTFMSGNIWRAAAAAHSALSLFSSVSRKRTERLKRSEEHTFELQSPYELVCRLLLEKKKHRL